MHIITHIKTKKKQKTKRVKTSYKAKGETDEHTQKNAQTHIHTAAMIDNSH